MIVSHVYLLLILPIVFTDSASNDVDSQLRKMEADMKTDDGIIPYASLQDVIRSLQKELKATKAEVTKVKEDVKQVVITSVDVAQFEKEIANNKKAIEGLASGMKYLKTSMKDTYQSLREGLNSQLEDLKKAIVKNSKDIASITTTDATAELKALKTGIQSDKKAVAARLDSVNTDLTNLRKSYGAIKFQTDYIDSLKHEVKKNTKDIASNADKLRGEITKNTADIKGLRKVADDAKSIAGSVSSSLTSLIKTNAKAISSNTDKLQDQITKNVVDIQGLIKDLKKETSSVSSRLTSLGATVTALTKSYNDLKSDVKSDGSLKALKKDVDKNSKAIASGINAVKKEISKNAGAIKGLKKDTESAKASAASASSKVTAIAGDVKALTKIYDVIKHDVKHFVSLKHDIKKNTIAISSNTNKLQGEITKNTVNIRGLTKSFASQMKSMSKQLSTISGSVTSAVHAHKKFRVSTQRDIISLKATVYKNQKSISTNAKNLKVGISKNNVNIVGMKKDISRLTARLKSGISGLSTSWQAWFVNLKKSVKKTADGLRADVDNNKRSGVKLQSQIKKHAADIRRLDLYNKKTLSSMSGRLDAVKKQFSAVNAAQVNLQKELHKEVAGLKRGVKKNLLTISANTNSLNAKITKNTKDIDGLRHDMKKQVSSVSSHLTSVEKGLNTKITSVTISTKHFTDRMKKEEIGIGKVAKYAEGIKLALASTAQIVFYPKGTTQHYSLDVYREYNAHFFAYGWPHKYDRAHKLGRIGLKSCIRGCYQMKKRDRRWKAVAYYSEGTHCWCYQTNHRTIQPHSTVLTYMLM